MNKNRIYKITSIIIALIGVGYMGYADAKGLDNNYGLIITGLGLFLSLLVLFFGSKENK